MYVIYLGLLFQFSAFLCQAQQDTANVMDGWLAPGRGPENEEVMLVLINPDLQHLPTQMNVEYYSLPFF